MKDVGAFEAKTHFSQLLREVEEGETVIIYKRGKKVAKLVPVHENYKRVDVAELIRKNRKGVKLPEGVTVKDLISEGRK